MRYDCVRSAPQGISLTTPQGAVAFPVSAEEVSKLVVFASQHQLDTAVKGGGHSTGGTSATNGGLVIDLSNMRQVTVDPNGKTITAQGGATWELVDEAAGAHGLATVGGTANDTGVGGLTLGGGFGWLSGMYGLVIDNLVAAKVVIANGRILNASESENPDLFWALRGAGHNFGVVTEFQYKAHDQPNPVYAGALMFTPDKLDSLVYVLNERHSVQDPRGGFQCAFATLPGAPGPVVIVICFYNGDEDTAKKYLAPLLELGPVNNMLQSMPYAKVNGIMKAMAPPGGRKALKGGSFSVPIRKEFVQRYFGEYTRKLAEDPELAASFLVIEIYGRAKTVAVPVEATAFATRGNFHAGIMGLAWKDPEKDEEVRAWGRYLQAMCREEVQAVAELDPKLALEYANYFERESSPTYLCDVINRIIAGDLDYQSIFGVNHKRLASLKAKYDPGFLFYKTSPIPPVKAA